MTLHLGDPDVQNGGCLALMRLCITPEHVDTILQEGGARAIVEAMREHAMHKTFQDYALSFLSTLLEWGHEESREQRATLLRTSGAAQTTLDVVRNHESLWHSSREVDGERDTDAVKRAALELLESLGFAEDDIEHALEHNQPLTNPQPPK